MNTFNTAKVISLFKSITNTCVDIILVDIFKNYLEIPEWDFLHNLDKFKQTAYGLKSGSCLSQNNS